MNAAPEFPPLLTGIAVAGDPLAAASDAALKDGEPGSVFYGIDPTAMRVAILLAPEETLGTALRVSFAATLAFNDALGALAPPEVALHLVWPDGIKVNGAICGQLRVKASTSKHDAEPDWLILALDVPVLTDSDAPGATPDQTCLTNEGCGDILIPDLIEAWGRHMMHWLHTYMSDGFEPLHRDWLAKADGREDGSFLGLDENGGMLFKEDSGTRIIPLTKLLEPS